MFIIKSLESLSDICEIFSKISFLIKFNQACSVDRKNFRRKRFKQYIRVIDFMKLLRYCLTRVRESQNFRNYFLMRRFLSRHLTRALRVILISRVRNR